jgi:hypothetical protein
MKRSVRVFISAFIFFASGCVHSPTRFGWNIDRHRIPASDEIDTTHIDGQNYYWFQANSSSPPYRGYIKFVVPVAGGTFGAITAQNTNKFPFHSDYLSQRPEFKGMTRDQIDEVTLKTGPKQKALIGTLLMRSIDNDPITDFEIVSKDPVPAATVKIVKEKIENDLAKNFLKVGAYVPTYEQIPYVKSNASLFEALGIKVAFLDANSENAVYSPGWSFGRLRLQAAATIDADLRSGAITSKDILLLDEVPKEIPPVAGIVSAKPTAPSSHVALLAQMYDIPFSFSKELYADLSKRNGEWIYLKVDERSQEVLGNLGDQDRQKLSELKSRRPFLVTADWATKAITNVESLKETAVPAYGGKATRMGLLRRVLPDNTPAHAVGIPIHYFKRFMTEAKTATGQPLGTFVAAELARISTETTSHAQIQDTLKVLRESVKKSTISTALFRDIQTALEKEFPGSSVRLKLRSSSNVEDGAEFNGAGLYDSEGVWLKGAPPDKAADTVEKGLRKVWSSLYSDRGYLARRQFKVDESKVGMGVLAQPPYKGEVANGVLILSKPEYSTDMWTTITGFPGEDNTVTNPTGTEQPEISSVSFDISGEGGYWDLKQRTTLLPAGQTLMHNEEYTALARMAGKVWTAIGSKNPDFKLDFEWKKLDGTNQSKLILKQVRPVPTPKSNSLKDGSRFVLLGQNGIHFAGDTGEGAYAVLRHFSPTVEMDFPTLTAKQLSAGSVVIPRLVLSMSHEKTALTNVKGKVTVTPYASDPAGKSTRTWTIAVPLTNSMYSGLSMSIVWNEDQSKAPMNGVVTTESAGKMFSIPLKENAFITAMYPNLDQFNRNYQWSVRTSDRMPVKSRVPSEDEFVSKKYAFKLTGTIPRYSDFDKTSFIELNRAELSGLLPDARKLVVTQAAAMTYAPAHHNFGWEYMIDLFAADGLTDADRAFLDKTYGRYLLIGPSSSEGQQSHLAASVWTQGRATKVIETEFETGAPPVPGGDIPQ